MVALRTARIGVHRDTGARRGEAENRLGRRRTADISGAHEQNGFS
jgi:hypothetical protein